MILENERLRVEVSEPGDAYHRMRFDWTGVVTQVTLDGKHTFCTIELPKGMTGPDSEGVGLTNDFGLSMPVGWDEAAVGEGFPKLAVGTLTKTFDGKYDHMRDYPLIPTAKRAWQEGEEIRFSIDPLPCMGYAASFDKRIWIEGTSLFIETTMRNVGDRAIHTNEYNHNFVAVDGLPMDEGLTVEFSGKPTPQEGAFPLLDFDGNLLSFRGVPQVFWFGVDVPAEVGVRFTLRDTRAGVGMRERGDFPMAGMNVWGKEHTVCPETFVALDLEPGESYTWTRCWDFFNLD